MVHSPVLRAISFTGSNEIGGALYAKAAQRGAKVTCEMGGKNAVIVMADADLDKAAVAIHGGAFGSTGQRCTATSRVIASPSVKDALVERLVEAAKKIKIGPGLDEIGRHGTGGGREAVEDRLGLHQHRPARRRAAWFSAAISPITSTKVTSSSRRSSIMSSRACAFSKKRFSDPCSSVSTAKTIDEALAFANGVEYGLTTSIFTENIDTIMRFVEEVETGMVHVNEPTIGGEAQLPFGGTKATGVGEREMAEEGFEFLYRAENRFYQLLGQSRAFDDSINKKAHGQKRPRALFQTGAACCAPTYASCDYYLSIGAAPCQ